MACCVGRGMIAATCESPPYISAQVLRLSAVGIGLLYGSVKLKHYQVRHACPSRADTPIDPALCMRELQVRDPQADILNMPRRAK